MQPIGVLLAFVLGYGAASLGRDLFALACAIWGR